jgi:hypothetical protein
MKVGNRSIVETDSLTVFAWNLDGQLITIGTRALFSNLIPKAALAQHITVIAREHDDGVLVEVAVLEQLNELAHLVIHKAACREVSTSSTDLGLVWHRVVPEVDSPHQTLRVLVLLFLGDLDLW